MAQHVVEMYMENRGEWKNGRSYEKLVAVLGDEGSATEPDEDGVFEIELDADDAEHARTRALNAVAVAAVGEHVMLLRTEDLPEGWHGRAGAPKVRTESD